jgi:peptide chain release factor subunit 1
VVETMNQVFIRDGSQPIISGIIMAGSAEFKTVVSEADFIDYRLKPLILGVIDTSYGGE